MITLFEDFKLKNFINTVKKAKTIATKAHQNQYRKSGEPYIIHPEEVAKIIHKVKSSKEIAALIAAAYLHDTVEDTNITLDDIKEQFGDLIMSLVNEVTSNKEKLKLSGKEEYLIDKVLNISSWALVIKLADRLHNMKDFKKIMKSNDKNRKNWVIKYAKQTKNIIEELEWYRKLSFTQKILIKKIKKKYKPYINENYLIKEHFTYNNKTNKYKIMNI